MIGKEVETARMLAVRFYLRIFLTVITSVGLFLLISCSTDHIEDPVSLEKNALLGPDDLCTSGPSSGTAQITKSGNTATYTVVASHTGNQWCYTVSQVGSPNLSHFLIILDCIDDVLSTSPTADSVGYDGSTGYTGVKWETPSGVSTPQTFCITMDSNFAEGTVSAVVKASNQDASISILGPCCDHDQGGG